ncbi:MAG TPA: NUDIX domain-containing protein [Candidatus Paceibacterota bacterium]|nr:NUDIX domain-containing protein [Candidatus Paceibacterota bacterium]
MENDLVLQVGVKILLSNDSGKFLLLRRSLEKYPEIQGGWDIVGGRINPGTPLLENLRREVREETGLELIGEPRLVAAQDILRNPKRHVVRLTYVGVSSGEVRLDVSENDDYKWYTKDEILTLEDVDMYFKELRADMFHP